MRKGRERERGEKREGGYRVGCRLKDDQLTLGAFT